MQEILINGASWLRPYINDCAMAIIATILVIYGNDINNAIKGLVKKQHFIVRTFTFILVCAFGYGLMTVWLTPLLAKLLLKLPSMYLVPAVVVVFVSLGLVAQKQRHI
jgi:hypothetical protein